MSSKPSAKSSSSKSGSSKSSSKKASSSSSSSSSASKRLIQELATSQKDIARNPAIERLEPVSDDDLFRWEAVINGRGLGGGYEAGRWLLDIRVPDGKGKDDKGSYPLVPPVVTFKTRICASNVAYTTGEICLDLLKGAWTPAYTLSSTVDAIVQMLGVPEVDSPLNVDVAALLRQGDRIGAEALVRWVSAEERYDGR